VAESPRDLRLEGVGETGKYETCKVANVANVANARQERKERKLRGERRRAMFFLKAVKPERSSIFLDF
jgi:hypothetical protein